MKTCTPAHPRIARFSETRHRESDYIEQPFDLPDSSEAIDEPKEPSDLEDFGFEPDDDAAWDVFIPDDDEYDIQPDPNDFDAGLEPGAWSEEPE